MVQLQHHKSFRKDINSLLWTHTTFLSLGIIYGALHRVEGRKEDVNGLLSSLSVLVAAGAEGIPCPSIENVALEGRRLQLTFSR